MRKLIQTAVLVAAALAAATSTMPPAAADGPGPGPIFNPNPAHSPAPISSPGPPGSFGIHLLEVPTDLANDPRAQTYIVDHLKPGTIIKRHVEVSNNTPSLLHVSMYPDAATIANGAFVGAVSETVNELSTWTTLNQDSLDVPAGDTVEDTVTITVPQDAAPGERYAVVFAAASKSSSTGIKLIYRTGVRIYLSVGGDNPPASKFTVNTLTAQREHNGRAVVKAMVHNTGGRALDMFGTLTLTAVSGAMTAGPYPVRLGTTLAPGQSEPVTVAVPDPVSDGPWNAVIDLKSGLLDETYQARITFPSAPGSTSMAMAYPKPAAGSYVVPLLAGGLLVSALLGASAYRITRQRRHRRKNPNLP